MGDLRTRLQAALADAYRVERELGGGGLSRVFLAQEYRVNKEKEGDAARPLLLPTLQAVLGKNVGGTRTATPLHFGSIGYTRR